jgi:NAD-reducing hydrogenase large subunit
MPKGYPDGIYRVGPLARMNVADRCGTPRADQELAEFHELQRTACSAAFTIITPGSSKSCTA